MRNSFKFIILDFVTTTVTIYLTTMELIYLPPFQLIALGFLS